MIADSRPWLHDLSHRAVTQWLHGWRTVNASASLPSLAFARHLGDHARQMAQGLPADGRPDLLRRFSSAGYDGRCVCGRDPTSWPDDGVVQPSDEGVALTAPIDLPKWMLEAYTRGREGSVDDDGRDHPAGL